MNWDDYDWLTDEQKRNYKLLELKAKRQVRLERERKQKARREVFDMIFPEFEGMPIVWIVIAVVCVLFSMLTLII